MAAGKAVDATLSHVGHQIRLGRHPTQVGVRSFAESILAEALAESAVAIPAEESARILGQVQRVVQAYRRSEIAGLPRPRSRVILIGEEVGVYAQPDYWDASRRIFEMKSYPADPSAPDIALQLRLFQLAFPTLEAFLVCLNRHVEPVTTSFARIPSPTSSETAETLGRAFALGLEFGAPKVLEYMEGPFVRYPRPDGGHPDPPG